MVIFGEKKNCSNTQFFTHLVFDILSVGLIYPFVCFERVRQDYAKD